MVDQEKIVKKIQSEGVEFITGVPDTLLNDFCVYVEKNWPKDKHVIAANEGNSIGLAAGYHLSTNTVPVVYMQNSGLGNTINPIVSLTHKDVYGIPLVLLVGWRGNPEVKDHAQHKKQGELTPVLMDDMDIPYKILEDDTQDTMNKFEWAIKTAKETNNAVGLIVKKGVLEKGEKEGFPDDLNYHLTREQAIDHIVGSLPEDTVYVAATGRATRELYEVRNNRGESKENDFLNVGAMGHTSSIALGIAIAKPEKLVVCLEGDSSAIMHLGALPTEGMVYPPNFLHVILNNGVHESVGGQESAGFNINLTEIAKNSGLLTVANSVKTKDEISNALKELLGKNKPALLDIHIKKGIRKDCPPLKFNHKEQKDSLMRKITQA